MMLEIFDIFIMNSTLCNLLEAAKTYLRWSKPFLFLTQFFDLFISFWQCFDTEFLAAVAAAHLVLLKRVTVYCCCYLLLEIDLWIQVIVMGLISCTHLMLSIRILCLPFQFVLKYEPTYVIYYSSYFRGIGELSYHSTWAVRLSAIATLFIMLQTPSLSSNLKQKQDILVFHNYSAMQKCLLLQGFKSKYVKSLSPAHWVCFSSLKWLSYSRLWISMWELNHFGVFLYSHSNIFGWSYLPELSRNLPISALFSFWSTYLSTLQCMYYPNSDSSLNIFIFSHSQLFSPPLMIVVYFGLADDLLTL